MMVFLAILLIIIVGYSLHSVRNQEIIDGNREGMLARYNKRLILRTIVLLIFVIFTVSGLSSDNFLYFAGGIIGAICALIMAIFVIHAAIMRHKFASMSDNDFVNLQIEKEEEEREDNNNEAGDSLFETAPPCPICGSTETRTSDDYRAKTGAKMVGGLIFGSLLRNYTNFNMAQTYYAKQEFKRSISIDKEYQCMSCGHVWKVTPNVSRSMQNQTIKGMGYQKLMIEHTNAMSKAVPEQLSTENRMKGLMDLYEAGVLTKEDYEKEMMEVQSEENNAIGKSLGHKSLKEEVSELRGLLNAGIISQEEFDAEMNKLLLS